MSWEKRRVVETSYEKKEEKHIKKSNMNIYDYSPL